jgi:1-acyl-sn-glycerol-3-phosphate acyltransferase
VLIFLYNGYIVSITGYEINGLENLPSDRPALIIYYHGAIPIDIYYFIAKTLILKNRLIHTVADNFLFNIPGAHSDFI